MTPEQFIDKWSRAERTERQAAQEHFIDLCHLLGEATPGDADPTGETYTFEKGVSKIDGRAGFADVWKRGHFGWEYKKDRANLDLAYQQLQLYSVALENPPLLIVSDTKRFRIYTNWTNTVQEKKEFALEDLAHAETRELLRDAFRNPERLRPARTRKQVTEDAAKEFVTIAERLRVAGYTPDKVAHFLNRLVFCLFAEDVNLLPDDLFKRVLDTLAKRRDVLKDRSQRMLSELFSNMQEGGEYGLEHILHFNGGLFDTDEALPLDADSFEILRDVAKQDWSAIDPSIFGTLFERFLDPDKRAQIGAHYTDAEKIMMIVDPVIVRPLAAEWEAVKNELADILSRGRAKDGRPGRAAINRAEIRLDQFLNRLAGMRVLDPACGSGNFLYMALQSLKDLEYRIIVEAETMGLARRVVHCGPENVKGIEINRYAAELARTTIWIGDIQWKRRNGFEAKEEPVLRPLDAIACRDALIEVEADGTITESRWPEADFIIGNPPFLGDREHNKKLGVDYTKNIRQLYAGRVAARADLVVYWFQKATELLIGNQVRSFGLVGTKSVAKGASRAPLDILASEERQLIFNAWTNEPWVVEGAAVRVSIVCALSPIAKAHEHPSFVLNGQFVSHINPDLSTGTDVTRAQRLDENHDVAYQGVKLTGPFDILGKEARSVLLEPLNPNGRANQDVIRRL
jgi:type II restriction/modification system DNA methylase subunit YeeA